MPRFPAEIEQTCHSKKSSTLKNQRSMHFFTPSPDTIVCIVFLFSIDTVSRNKECSKTSDQKTHQKESEKRPEKVWQDTKSSSKSIEDKRNPRWPAHYPIAPLRLLVVNRADERMTPEAPDVVPAVKAAIRAVVKEARSSFSSRAWASLRVTLTAMFAARASRSARSLASRARRIPSL